VPSAAITVADIPPSPAISFRAAWNAAADSAVTGSSRMAVNVAMGKAAAGSDATVDADGTKVGEGGAPEDSTAAIVSVTVDVEGPAVVNTVVAGSGPDPQAAIVCSSVTSTTLLGLAIMSSPWSSSS